VPLTVSMGALVLTVLLMVLLKTQFFRFRPADR
jgi:hypothetical protein